MTPPAFHPCPPGRGGSTAPCLVPAPAQRWGTPTLGPSSLQPQENPAISRGLRTVCGPSGACWPWLKLSIGLLWTDGALGERLVPSSPTDACAVVGRLWKAPSLARAGFKNLCQIKRSYGPSLSEPMEPVTGAPGRPLHTPCSVAFCPPVVCVPPRLSSCPGLEVHHKHR